MQRRHDLHDEGLDRGVRGNVEREHRCGEAAP
jgi:hypothetical protein